jgi:very-short-patch-repair endonuclease
VVSGTLSTPEVGFVPLDAYALASGTLSTPEVGFVPLRASPVAEGNVVRADQAEPRVLRLARGQHAAVTAPQLAAAGVTGRWVERRVERGWLRRMHRGVYLVGVLESAYSPLMAATLAAGPGALLSHYAAAVLWGLLAARDGPIDVTVPGRKARNRPGVRVHRAALHPVDATRHHRIPVTSPARTLLDLGTHITQRELDRVTEEAQVQRRVTPYSLTEQFERYPRHRGTAALSKAIGADPKLTRSEAERLALQLIRRARLPEPATNARIGGWEADRLWRNQRLIAEVDGYAFHSSRSSFERDRRKDAELAAQGYRVIRVTWRQLSDEPEALVARLAAALAA